MDGQRWGSSSCLMQPMQPTLYTPQAPPHDINRPQEKMTLQHQVKTLQQQMQSLLNSSFGSVIGSNSGKSQILSALFSLTSTKTQLYSWILDSGAIDHMIPTVNMFVSYEPCRIDKQVQTVDGALIKVVGIGSIKLATIGLLTDVLYVPNLFVSLISVQKIAK